MKEECHQCGCEKILSRFMKGGICLLNIYFTSCKSDKQSVARTGSILDREAELRRGAPISVLGNKHF